MEYKDMFFPIGSYVVLNDLGVSQSWSKLFHNKTIQVIDSATVGIDTLRMYGFSNIALIYPSSDPTYFEWMPANSQYFQPFINIEYQDSFTSLP